MIDRTDPMTTAADPVQQADPTQQADPAPPRARAKTHPTARALEQRLREAGKSVRNAMRAVVDQSFGSAKRRTQKGFEQSLGLSHALANRVYSTVRTADPLVALQAMPGVQGLRLVLEAAERGGVAQETTERAIQAVERLERLIREDVGGRQALDTLLIGWLPEAREKFELAQRQAVFKGMSTLKGFRGDVGLVCHLLHPSAEPDAQDRVCITADWGVRRLRAGATIHSVRLSQPRAGEGKAAPALTLDGEPVDVRHGPALLEAFSTLPRSAIHVCQEGDGIAYALGDNGVGLESAVNLATAELHRGQKRRYGSAAFPTTGCWIVADMPTQTLILDVLLHEDVWPGCEPELVVYDTVVRGVANPNDASRNFDRLDVAESIEFLGRGAANFWAAEVEDYPRLIEYACGKLGWDAEKFRGYRCRIRYPIYGSQVCMSFTPPPAPRDA